jgi:hypothetical protein
MSESTQSLGASNGSGNGAARGVRTSFSDVARAHYDWDVAARASERRDARAAFERVLGRFEQTEVGEGHLADEYWCQRDASGVALAETSEHPDSTSRFRRLLQRLRLWYPFPEYRLYRETDWVTVEYPKLANLLHECDVLAVKARWGLEGVHQAVVVPWLMAVEKHVLGFLESEWRRGNAGRESQGRGLLIVPPSFERESAAAKARREQDDAERDRLAGAKADKFYDQIQRELSRIEDYYQRAGEKQARLHYLTGMVAFGVAIVALTGLASAGALAAFGLLDLHSAGVRRFYACMAAGAFGAIVSVLIRMGGRRGGFNIDHELGSSGVRRLGACRPLIGAISGVALSLLVQTTLVPIKQSALTFDFFVIAAFLAGFSERWTQVVLGGAMRTIEKVGDEQEQDKPSGRTRATGGHAAPTA